MHVRVVERRQKHLPGEIDDQGRMKKGTRPWIDGTFAGPDEAMELLAFHLHRLGAGRAEVVTFVADGAPWVWERLAWVERRVGLKPGRAVRVLDWCHAVHNLSLALEALGLAEGERQRLYGELRGWLRQGWHGLVLSDLETLGEAGVPARELMLGGEALRSGPLQHYRRQHPAVTVFNHYGPTEATVACLNHSAGPGQ